MIEFQMPDKQQMSLNGVEYKAIPSGSHHISDDFVYVSSFPTFTFTAKLVLTERRRRHVEHC